MLYCQKRAAREAIAMGVPMALFRHGGKINVIYKNGIRDRVSPALLTTLLETGQVASFERSDGWVSVGRDPIRKTGQPGYPGPERRLC